LALLTFPERRLRLVNFLLPFVFLDFADTFLYALTADLVSPDLDSLLSAGIFD